ncbi:MAG: hypothetical protein ABSH41_18340 [Syntrophobacteraceae bacterium]
MKLWDEVVSPAGRAKRGAAHLFEAAIHVSLGHPETMKRRLNDRQLAQPGGVYWGLQLIFTVV